MRGQSICCKPGPFLEKKSLSAGPDFSAQKSVEDTTFRRVARPGNKVLVLKRQEKPMKKKENYKIGS